MLNTDYFVLLAGDPTVAAQGCEGAMWKRFSSPYLPGLRSPNWLKVKIDKEVDAIIVGVEEGEGRLKGCLGALRVKDGQGNEFKIGTGFSDAERSALWVEFRDGALLGKIVTVTYQKDQNIVGRFPRYVRVREEL